MNHFCTPYNLRWALVYVYVSVLMYDVSLYVGGFVPDSTKSWELPEFVPFCAPYILSLEYIYVY